jgi:hypothetical protein
MIVSVSRRCDIPRFRFKWFMERIDEGFAEVANPFNSRQVKRVPLLPRKAGMEPAEGADVLVFWTRDPRNILANAEELTQRGFRFYVMVTVTGYPSELEPDMTRTSEALAAMKELAGKIGQDRVIWRYDPVILTSVTGEDFHRRNFSAIAQNLAGSVRRVIISVYDEYRSSKRRMEGLERAGVFRMLEAGAGSVNLLADLAKIAGETGMEIQSCAEKEDYSSVGVKPGACIDPALIGKLWGLEFKGKDKNQRPNCLCCQSVDIGSYGTCEARCVYCYAR